MPQPTSADQPQAITSNQDPFEQALQLLTSAVAQRKARQHLNEAVFDRFLEAAPDPTLAMNADGDIVFVNTQVETLFGYHRSELLGQKIETLLPKRFRPLHIDHRTDFTAHPRHRAMGTGGDLYARRKDGTEFQVEISLGPFESADGALVLAAVRDVTERKRADRLAAIVDGAEGAIIGKNLDGIIVAWNRGAERLYGYSPAEVIGKSVSILLLPDQISAFPALLEKVTRGGTIDEEEIFRTRKDGTLVQVANVASPIRDNTGQVIGLSSVSYDITKRKQAEEIARRHAAKMAEQAALLDLAHDAILVRDLAKSQIIFWNKGARELYGWEEAETLLDTAHHLLKTIFPYPPAEIEKQLFQTGRWDGELIQTKSDGSSVIVSSRWALQRDENNTPLSILEINRDITSQKRAEQASLEAKTQLQMALTGGQICTWTLDLQTNVAVYDDNSPRLFGLPAQSTTMQTASMLPFVHPEDQDAVNAEIARAVATGHYNIEYRVRWPDGSIHFLAASAETVYDGNKALKLTGACWDITARKTAETALRLSEASLIAANVALQQSNRELEHFASIASHDLQEPLRKVQAFGDRLKITYAPNLDAQGLDILNRMLNAVQRMQTLVNDLLAFSQVTIQNRPFVATDLGQILKEVLSDLEIRIIETAALVQTGPLPTIDADPPLMRQLFQNLLSNALKFHKPGQPPTVRVRAEIVNAAVCRIIVEDDGIGFDEKYLDRIFTIFQRLHGRAEYPGTGIGLAICRKIAQRHGGDLTARSSPGRGAAFIVTLPSGTLPKTP